jgi:hypothetical protein
MKHTYDQVVQWYLDCRNDIDRIDAEADRAKAPLREKMAVCEAWLTEQADKDGLTTVPTKHGTAYWSTHATCTCGSRDMLFDYVRKNEAWDLLESRPSKKAVQSLIEATGSPPPGVNYSTFRKLVIRTKE